MDKRTYVSVLRLCFISNANVLSRFSYVFKFLFIVMIFFLSLTKVTMRIYYGGSCISIKQVNKHVVV